MTITTNKNPFDPIVITIWDPIAISISIESEEDLLFVLALCNTITLPQTLKINIPEYVTREFQSNLRDALRAHRSN